MKAAIIPMTALLMTTTIALAAGDAPPGCQQQDLPAGMALQQCGRSMTLLLPSSPEPPCSPSWPCSP